jgi:hypothetical protein
MAQACSRTFGFTKKTDEMPRKEIERAERIKADHESGKL